MSPLSLHGAQSSQDHELALLQHPSSADWFPPPRHVLVPGGHGEQIGTQCARQELRQLGNFADNCSVCAEHRKYRVIQSVQFSSTNISQGLVMWQIPHEALTGSLRNSHWTLSRTSPQTEAWDQVSLGFKIHGSAAEREPYGVLKGWVPGLH